MQLKKLLLINIFLIGSIFLVAGCHGYYKGYKGNSTVEPSFIKPSIFIEHPFIEHPFIEIPFMEPLFMEGSILERDIIDASCSIAGLDKSGKETGEVYDVTVNKTPSIVYRTKTVTKTPKLQITCNGKTKSDEQGIAQIVVNRGVTPQKVKIPIIDIFSSGNTIGNTEIGSNFNGVMVDFKQHIPFHLSIKNVENASKDVTYAIISDKAKAKAIEVTLNVDVYDLFKDAGTQTTFTVCMIAQGGDVKDCTAKTSIKNPTIKNHILAVSTFKATISRLQILTPSIIVTTSSSIGSIIGPVIGAVAIPSTATSPTVSKEPKVAKWVTTVEGIEYTIILPSTYQQEASVNFGVKVTNGDGDYLVVSNGTDAFVVSGEIVGNKETDVYVDNIKSLIQGVLPDTLTGSPSNPLLYMCVSTKKPTNANQCKSGFSLTVFITPMPKTTLTATITGIPGPSIIGYSPRETKWIAKAVGADYTIILPSTYYHQGGTVNFGVQVTNGDGKYLVVSNATDAVSSASAISGNGKQEVGIDDISKLLTSMTPGSSKQLYLCVLNSAATSGTDCTSINKLAELTVSVVTQ